MQDPNYPDRFEPDDLSNYDPTTEWYLIKGIPSGICNSGIAELQLEDDHTAFHRQMEPSGVGGSV